MFSLVEFFILLVVTINVSPHLPPLIFFYSLSSLVYNVPEKLVIFSNSSSWDSNALAAFVFDL